MVRFLQLALHLRKRRKEIGEERRGGAGLAVLECVFTVCMYVCVLEKNEKVQFQAENSFSLHGNY